MDSVIDESHTVIIDRANPGFYLYAVTLVFFTLLSPSWPVLILWSSGAAVLGAYLFFRNCSLVPNLLIHLKPVNYQEQVELNNSDKTCPVCGGQSCSRHTSLHDSNTMPWEDLTVPKTIDDTLSEFLQIVFKRFIKSWHDNITNDQTFPDDVKFCIRYGVCTVLNRAAKIDMPQVLTGPLMRTVADHIDVYLKVRRNLPPSATQKDIQQEVWKVLGSKLHFGMRGNMGDLDYFRNLTRNVLPLLLPQGSSESRVMNLFLEELFATKVMIPAMDYVATPDFLNKILILIFDKESKLVHMIGPRSQLVPLLEDFVLKKKRSTVQVPINHLIKSQRLLYPFIQYLKKNGGIHILQFYLSCNELRKSIVKLDIMSLDDKVALTYIDQISRLYNLYMSTSGDNRVYFSLAFVYRIEQILTSDYPNELKLLQLMEYKLLDIACNSVLVNLERFFCPNFFHSEQYHDSMMPIMTGSTSKRNTLYTAPSSLSKHFEKWRRRRKRVHSLPNIQETFPNPQQQQDLTGSVSVISRARSESTSSLSSSPVADSLEETVVVHIPSYVQIVDWEIVTTQMKKFTVYCIVSKIEDGDDKLVYRVQRRYKEFSVLDTRIHQFYDDVHVHLPPKKTIKNMDKTFIESRAKELEKYLKTLIKEPEVQGSQLLRSFLTETQDISLFMPNTMGDKAGKIIKSVPHILKKESKGQNLENLLLTMESCIAAAPRQCSFKKKLQCEQEMEQNFAIIREYEKAMASDKSNNHTKNMSWFSPQFKTGTAVSLNGVLDFVVYLAIHVYGVSHTQLATLLAVKMLGQNSIEAYIQHMLSNRIKLILMENNVTDLIELLRTNLFFNKSPPRTSSDKETRYIEATQTVLTRPPDILIRLIGRERYETNTKLLLEGLQDPLLNRQMLFSMLDVVLWELFPELKVSADETRSP